MNIPLRGLGGPRAAAGTVHIVGGGPGDPSYLTLRAATVLATCDVVAYDRLAPPEALDLVPADADRICVGRRATDPGRPREEVDELLRARAAAGQAVVRLKGGDPFVFGRGAEEAEACSAAGTPFEVVPGVTSPVAVPGAVGIPLTHRDVAAGFAVVTGHERAGKPASQVDPAALARFPGTVVVLMGLERLRALAAELIHHGRAPDTPVAVVASGTTPQQAHVTGTLEIIADAVEARQITPPAVIVVGDVAGRADRAGWREGRPLHGLRVLLPRLGEGPSRLAPQLRHSGGAVVEVAVAAEVPGDPAALARLAADLRAGEVGTLVISSAPGLERLLDTIIELGSDVRALAGVTLWAVGRRVSEELRERSLAADRDVPTVHELGDAAGLDTAPAPVVVLVGEEDPLDALAQRTRMRRVISTRLRRLPAVEVPDVDAVVVPTSRVVAPLLAAVPTPPAPFVTLGPASSRALRHAGHAPSVEVVRPTPEALVAALADVRAARHATPAAERVDADAGHVVPIER